MNSNVVNGPDLGSRVEEEIVIDSEEDSDYVPRERENAQNEDSFVVEVGSPEQASKNTPLTVEAVTPEKMPSKIIDAEEAHDTSDDTRDDGDERILKRLREVLQIHKKDYECEIKSLEKDYKIEISKANDAISALGSFLGPLVDTTVSHEELVKTLFFRGRS